jgi:hypothetical protein
MENPSDKILTGEVNITPLLPVRRGQKVRTSSRYHQKAQAQIKRITFLAGMTLPD